jgi:hypothetical protein
MSFKDLVLPYYRANKPLVEQNKEDEKTMLELKSYHKH